MYFIQTIRGDRPAFHIKTNPMWRQETGERPRPSLALISSGLSSREGRAGSVGEQEVQSQSDTPAEQTDHMASLPALALSSLMFLGTFPSQYPHLTGTVLQVWPCLRRATSPISPPRPSRTWCLSTTTITTLRPGPILTILTTATVSHRLHPASAPSSQWRDKDLRLSSLLLWSSQPSLRLSLGASCPLWYPRALPASGNMRSGETRHHYLSQYSLALRMPEIVRRNQTETTTETARMFDFIHHLTEDNARVKVSVSDPRTYYCHQLVLFRTPLPDREERTYKDWQSFPCQSVFKFAQNKSSSIFQGDQKLLFWILFSFSIWTSCFIRENILREIDLRQQ